MMIINTRIVKDFLLKPIFLWMLFLNLLSTAAFAEDVALDKIIAIVNDDVVMFSEVRRVALRYKQS